MTDATPLVMGIRKMLNALGAKPDLDRVQSFVDALDDAHLCHDCAEKATRRVTSFLPRRPVPRDLLEETRDLQVTGEHQAHVSDRATLGPGDTGRWWVTQAPIHVRRVWPELTGDQAVKVARQLAILRYVEPAPEAIAVELGYVDHIGPTPERQWWIEHMKAIA